MSEELRLYNFEYRCRRCAVITRTNCMRCTRTMAAFSVVGFTGGETIPRNSFHICDDGGVGLDDLIGASPEVALDRTLSEKPIV